LYNSEVAHKALFRKISHMEKSAANKLLRLKKDSLI